MANTSLKTMLVLLFFISACTSDLSTKDNLIKDESLNDFNWLIGSWKRINDELPQQTYEFWIKEADSLYKGHGYTLINLDTIWQEFIRLEYEQNIWKYKVTSINNSISTNFELNGIDTLKFTCFNLENDFPTHIAYQRDGNNLNAVISKDSIKVPFNFIKMK